MKSILLIFGTVLYILSFSGCPDLDVPADLYDPDPEIPAVSYNIGDTGPAGGLIFYVDLDDTYPGWKYLEAAPVNWEDDDSDNIDPVYPWGGYGMDCGDTFTTIGSGKANTLALIDHTHDPTHTAALQIYYANGIDGERREIGGFSDWFLPSKDELTAMYNNLYSQKPSLGDFSTTYLYYWSSSETDELEAERILMGKEINFDKYKSDINSVRPARSF